MEPDDDADHDDDAYDDDDDGGDDLNRVSWSLDEAKYYVANDPAPRPQPNSNY